MTLRNLQVFVAVAECGNMTKAAEKLFISQPSVSLTISEIEREFDVMIFDRYPGHLQLTQTGELLLQYSQKMLDIEKEMNHLLRHESLNYCIRIGATITVGSTIISPIIAEMKKVMPKVNYHVSIANTHIIESMLERGEVDIALVEGDIKSPLLEVKSIIKDRLVLICPYKHPFGARDSVDIIELEGVPLILREERSGTREQLLSAMRQKNVEATIRWSSYSYSAILDAVEYGLGVSVISEMLVQKYKKTGAFHMCSIDGAALDRSFKLVYNKNKYISEVMSKFSRICQDIKFLDSSL